MIEIVVALALIAILAAIAIPSYLTYATKSRRSEALQTLLAMQLAEEKYRITNSSYGNLAAVWGGVTTTENGYYTLSITNLSGSTYTLTAVAGTAQSGDTEGGTACTTLTLAYANGTSTKSPSVCWLND